MMQHDRVPLCAANVYRFPVSCLLGLIICCGCSDRQSPGAALRKDAVQSKSGTTGSQEPEQLSRLAEGLTFPVQPVEKIKQEQSVVAPRFEDVSDELGIQFTYDNGATPDKLTVQSTGGGAGWIDADADGYPDLYLVQGGKPFEQHHSSNPSDCLYRNQRGQAFHDVTDSAGIDERGHSHGLSVADFDGDGFDDVFVTNTGLDTLYHNCGDGTFLDVTQSSRVLNHKWSTSAAWHDLNLDGDLDLYVCNYLDYDVNHPIPCRNSSGQPGICHPADLPGVQNQLFLNNNDGTFSEVSGDVSRGLEAPESKSLGVVIADLTGDSRPDIFVANDTSANHLFVNEGGVRFVEQGYGSGCAVDTLGRSQANMGVALGDFNQDGYPDLYVTHFTSESNTLYRGLGNGGFEDVTRQTGLHIPTLPFLGFGTVMSDFDFDGNMDLFIANGHIDDSYLKQGESFEMPAQLFTFNGQTWIEQTTQCGSYFSRAVIGRGAAMADFDLDGDPDLVVVHQNSKAAILRNSETHGTWLKIGLKGAPGNRRGFGAEVRVTQGARVYRQELAGGGSYCSSHEPCLFFGLGANSSDCQIEIRWPDGRRQRLESVGVNQPLTLHYRDGQ